MNAIDYVKILQLKVYAENFYNSYLFFIFSCLYSQNAIEKTLRNYNIYDKNVLFIIIIICIGIYKLKIKNFVMKHKCII